MRRVTILVFLKINVAACLFGVAAILAVILGG
jgi:hypothetical protein